MSKPVPRFCLLELESSDDFTAALDAVIIVDEPARQRAYRVSLTYSVAYEAAECVRVLSWWSDDLVEQALSASDAEAVADLLRFVDSSDDVSEALVERWRYLRADAEAAAYFRESAW